jgi:hypothetical protein
MSAYQPQLEPTQEFHVAVRGFRHHTPHHRRTFAFRAPGGLPKQSTTGRVSALSVPAQGASALIPSVKTIAGGTPINSLLVEFPDLTRPAGVQREIP